MSYLCLNGTWVFIFAESKLENGFLTNSWGPVPKFDNLNNLGVKCFKS